MNNKRAFIMFFAIVFAVNILVNLYIYIRTRTFFQGSAAAAWIFNLVFWVVAFSYLIGRFTERTGAMWIASPFIKTGSWWLGAMLYLTLLFLFIDIFRGIFALFNIEGLMRFQWASPKGHVALVVVYAITAIILAFGSYFANNPVVRVQQIGLDKAIPGGKLRVVLVSDIHLGMMISNGRLDTLVEMVNRQDADVILLAGDVFDEDLGPVIKNNMGDLLRNFKSRYGTFAILGNHEFYGGAIEANKYLEAHNITVLRDSHVVLPNETVIAGREDQTARQMNSGGRMELGQLLAGVDVEKPVILMDHQPYNLDEVAAAGVDLQVSGHTHHGQMWPFNYITGAIFRISRGYGQIGKSHFYISSGYGTWGPPIRTNSRSEIIVLEINGNE